jgi:hypothetical protein
VDNNSQITSDDQPTDHWARLDAFLQTDPHDAGCDEAMELLDVCAELTSAGIDPAERFPGLYAHFSACGPCAQDLEGLLAAIIRESHTSTEPDGPEPL